MQEKRLELSKTVPTDGLDSLMGDSVLASANINSEMLGTVVLHAVGCVYAVNCMPTQIRPQLDPGPSPPPKEEISNLFLLRSTAKPKMQSSTGV